MFGKLPSKVRCDSKIAEWFLLTNVPVEVPAETIALLSGLHMLLAMLQLLEQYTPAQFKTLAHQALPFLNPGG